MALKCPKCGEDNPKTNRFCDTCGAKLVQPAGGSTVVESVKAPAAGEKGSRKSERPGLADRVSSSVVSAVDGALTLDNYKIFWVVLILLGTFLRLWALGDKPLHHDESIHAWYSFKLFSGEDYKYDPAYHGPFLYHANALMYFIFGTSEWACRVLPAMFGVAMIWFLYHWRSLLGKTGSLVAASFVTISPTFSYVSRFIRDDIYMAMGSMAMVWGFFKYFEERKPKYLYWAAAGWIVSFTSMEATWIFMGIFGCFFLFRFLWEWSNPVTEENYVHQLLGFLFPRPKPTTLYGLIGSLGTLALGVVLHIATGGRTEFFNWISAVAALSMLGFVVLYLSQKEAKTLRVIAIIFFVPFTVLFPTMFFNADGWFIGAFDSLAYWLGEQKTGRADQPWFFYAGMLAMYELPICFFAIIAGLRSFLGSGKPHLFILKMLGGIIPLAIALFLLIKFPKDPRMLIPMAGFATLGSCIIAYCTFTPERENFFKIFLLYWSILAFFMFTLAGERMPWLTLHPLLPLTLLASSYLGEFFEREQPHFSEHWLGLSVLWLPVAAFLVMLVPQLIIASWQAPREMASWWSDYSRGDRHGGFAPSGFFINLWASPSLAFLPYLILLVTLFLVIMTPFILRAYPGLKRMTKGIWMSMLIIGWAVLFHGTSNALFYGDGANPAEPLVYVQSTTEVPKLARKLQDMSIALTGGLDMKIAVEDSCSWPLSWYFKDFKKATIGYHAPLQLDQATDGDTRKAVEEGKGDEVLDKLPPIVITAFDNNPPYAPNHDALVEAAWKSTHVPQRIKLRWWWGYPYDAVLGPDVSWKEGLGKMLRAFVAREPWYGRGNLSDPNFSKNNFGYQSPIGSYDMCVWIRKDVEKLYR